MAFYRHNYKIFLVNGILFNHESSLRPDSFLSKKIILKAIEIIEKKSQKLVLGNPDQLVDWGYAPDYIECFIKLLRQDKAGDYVISSGELHTVREFVEIVFNYFHLDYAEHVEVDHSILTGAQGGVLFGDNRKVSQVTGWKPHDNFQQWISKMCSEISQKQDFRK